MQASCLDDKKIPDDATLWRRVRAQDVSYDEHLKRSKPSSGAFSPSSDGSGMSAVWAELHLASNLSLADFLLGYEDFEVAAFLAGFVRSIGLEVQRDPVENQPAHVLVTGDFKKAQRRSLAAECSLLNRQQQE